MQRYPLEGGAACARPPRVAATVPRLCFIKNAESLNCPWLWGRHAPRLRRGPDASVLSRARRRGVFRPTRRRFPTRALVGELDSPPRSDYIPPGVRAGYSLTVQRGRWPGEGGAGGRNAPRRRMSSAPASPPMPAPGPRPDLLLHRAGVGCRLWLQLLLQLLASRHASRANASASGRSR